MIYDFEALALQKVEGLEAIGADVLGRRHTVKFGPTGCAIGHIGLLCVDPVGKLRRLRRGRRAATPTSRASHTVSG